MRSTVSRVDWTLVPVYAAHAHSLRSAEMRRMLVLLGGAIGGLARRLLAPGRRQARATGGPAPSSP